MNYLPHADFAAFLYEVKQKKECWYSDWNAIWYCHCESIHDEDWPVIYLYMGGVDEGHWFYLKGRDYLSLHYHSGHFDYETFKYVDPFYACTLMVEENLDAYDGWMLGGPFLRSHYTIYDMDNMRIGIVPVVEALRE